MLARGVARMVYQTAVEQKLELPANVQQMLNIVNETAWQSSDLQKFNSMYPNYAIARKPSAKPEDYLIEDVLKKFEESNITTPDSGDDMSGASDL